MIPNMNRVMYELWLKRRGEQKQMRVNSELNVELDVDAPSPPRILHR